MRVNFQVINQKDVPALQSGVILPPAGQKGRIFYNSSGVGMYIDNGSTWLAISTNSSPPGLPGTQIGFGDYNTGLLTSSDNFVYDTNEGIFSVSFEGYRKIFYEYGNVFLGDADNQNGNSCMNIGDNINIFKNVDKVKVGINTPYDPLANLEVCGKIKISNSIFGEPAALEFDNSMLTNLLPFPTNTGIKIIVGGNQYALPLYNLA